MANLPENEMTALARRYLIEGRQIVERQRQTVKRLEQIDGDAKGAKRTLELFEFTLAIFEDHLRELVGK
jgi:hypothetical protein